jgi:transcriptional regulator with XRE-family HTH domain
MSDVTRIHRQKQPNRPHHIRDWADRRHMSQSDIVEALGADKSVVSRWFSGATPSERWQDALAEIFHCDSRESLFRHPDDDWIAAFLQGRSRDEIERIKATLEAAFPKKVA